MNITRKSIAAAVILLSATGLCFAQSSPTRPNAAASASATNPPSSTSSTSPTTTTTTMSTGAPYTEGTVWAITMVKTKPGMSDDYIKGLAKTYKAAMEEEKKS